MQPFLLMTAHAVDGTDRVVQHQAGRVVGKAGTKQYLRGLLRY